MTLPDPDSCYRALSSRDSRFDGWFFAGITSTGIYCRPSCPARTPKQQNCYWFPTAAAAQAAGFRACRRCQPDAIPGSPRWNLGEDAAARAMRMIADGVVDRTGVAGLAERLGYSSRQVQRLLLDHAGAPPLALARTRRAHTARVLLQTTRLPVSEVAFQAGFSSIRQFNDTIREVYGQTPSALRGRRRGPSGASPGDTGLVLKLAVRQPFDARGLLAFLGARTVPGLESGGPTGLARTARLPRGQAVVAIEPDGDSLLARVALVDWRDLGTLVSRIRAWLDLDADPVAVDEVLAADPVVAGMVAAVPGIRIPGALDPDELAVRCLVGQQVSLQGATTITGRLVAEHGEPLDPVLVEAAAGWGHQLSHCFPPMEHLAALDPGTLPMPRARGRALVGLAAALASGRVSLAAGVDRATARRELQALPGIGPWTSGYVAMRGLGDPDVLLDQDLVVRRVLAAVGIEPTPRFAPWRSYLTMHLWRKATHHPTTPSRPETR